MTDVEKSETLHIWHVHDVENVTIYEKMPQYTRFHVEENWAQKYMCGEKMTNIMSAFRLYSDYILTTFWLHSDRPDICH